MYNNNNYYNNFACVINFVSFRYQPGRPEGRKDQPSGDDENEQEREAHYAIHRGQRCTRSGADGTSQQFVGTELAECTPSGNWC